MHCQCGNMGNSNAAAVSHVVQHSEPSGFFQLQQLANVYCFSNLRPSNNCRCILTALRGSLGALEK